MRSTTEPDTLLRWSIRADPTPRATGASPTGEPKILFFVLQTAATKSRQFSTTENDIQSSTHPLCKINDACQKKIEFLRAYLRYHDLQVEPAKW